MMKTLKQKMMKENCKSIPYQQNHKSMNTLTVREKYGLERVGDEFSAEDVAKPNAKMKYKQKKTGQ